MGIQNNMSLENVVTKLSVYFSVKKYSNLNEYTCYRCHEKYVRMSTIS